MSPRPLQHPKPDQITLEGILHALSDPARLSIVRELFHARCKMNCSEAKGRVHDEMPKSTCSLHFRVLRESGLVVGKRKGVELEHELRLADLNARFPGLIDSILQSFERDRKRKRRP